MKNIRLDYAKETIEITKAFEKKASVYGSLAYNELATVRRDFPTFKLKISEPKGSNGFKGMDYDFMRKYISLHDNSEENTKNLETLIERKLSYGEIKQWFIGVFPVFANCTTRAQWVLAA